MKRTFWRVGSKLNDEKLREMWRLRTKESWSYPAIGRLFGVDHTTVIYHLKRVALNAGLLELPQVGKPIRVSKATIEKIMPAYYANPPEMVEYALPECRDPKTGRLLIPRLKINLGHNYDYYKRKAKKDAVYPDTTEAWAAWT